MLDRQLDSALDWLKERCLEDERLGTMQPHSSTNPLLLPEIETKSISDKLVFTTFLSSRAGSRESDPCVGLFVRSEEAMWDAHSIARRRIRLRCD